MKRRLLVRTLTFGACFSIGLVYALRAYRTLAVAGDSAELVTAAVLWGIPHAPGYPLYTFALHLLTRIVREPAVVHLTSAVFHAVTLGLVAGAIEFVTGSIVGAAIGAGVLALGRVFFLGSLYADVFTLNDLVFACLLFLCIRAGRAARWAPLAIALGFGLAHHPMIVLAWPSIAVLVGPELARELRDRPWKGLGLFALALAPPAAAYALVPWAASRDPYLSWGDVHDLGSLVHLVTRQDYGGPLRASRNLAEGQLLERLDAFGGATWTSLGPIGSLLAGAGAIVACARERRVGVALVVAVLFAGPVFAAANAFDLHSTYRIAFFERFFSMCHVALAVLAGIGAARIDEWLRATAPSRAHPLGVTALGILALGPLLPNLTGLDMSSNRLGLAYAHDLVDSTPDGSLVLLKGDMPTQAALFACGVERRCGDRIVLAPGQLAMPWRRAQLERRHPELALPTGGADEIVARLVERELPHRPVFVHEELLDAAAAGPRAAVPSGLLFRIYPSTDAARADSPRFREPLTAFARGERCEGCPLRRSPHPLDEQLVRAYESALRAHASAARELGLDAHL